jgi:hypothetical protein
MRTNPIGISKRAKGFALQLSHQHWFIIRQIYPWLQSLGATDEDTDEALSLVPKWEINDKDLEEARKTGRSRALAYGGGFYRQKTLRVRADKLVGMIKLLNLTAAYSAASSQASGTFTRRAERLASVSSLDMLADAAR